MAHRFFVIAYLFLGILGMSLHAMDDDTRRAEMLVAKGAGELIEQMRIKKELFDRGGLPLGTALGSCLAMRKRLRSQLSTFHVPPSMAELPDAADKLLALVETSIPVQRDSFETLVKSINEADQIVALLSSRPRHRMERAFSVPVLLGAPLQAGHSGSVPVLSRDPSPGFGSDDD